MATEVGQAYVTLIPSARGFATRMQRELAGDIAKVGTRLGDVLGDKVGDGGKDAADAFGKSIKTGLSGDLDRLGGQLGDDFGEEVGQTGGKEASSKFGSVFKSGLGKIGALAGGLAIGGLLTEGITSALDMGAANAKITAGLGLTGKQSEAVGKAAGTLFANGYGEGMDQINEALGLVVKNIDGMRGASDTTLTRIGGKVTDVANIFDQDLGGVTRAVSQMLRTGMAKNADEALDIITKGFQGGVDKSDDFLDTLNEYGTQFHKLGLSGKDATGLLSQGLKGGARDADIVADGIKEFSIRSLESLEKLDAKGRPQMTELGSAFTNVLPATMDMYDAQKKLAGGGKGARSTFDLMLKGLKKIKDPASRSATAVTLFGTQAEDMGGALDKLDLSTASKGLGKVAGAASDANKKFNDTPAAKLNTFTRGLKQDLTDAMVKYVIPAVTTLTPYLDDLGKGFDVALGFIKGTVNFIKDNAKVVGTFAGVIAALTIVVDLNTLAVNLQSGALKAWLAQTKLVQAATKVATGVQILWNLAMAANPVVAVIIAIVALIAIIVLVIKKFHLWDNIVRGLGDAWKWLSGLIGSIWGGIKTAVSKGVSAVVGLVKGLPGRVMGIVKGLASKLAGIFSSMWNSVASVVKTGISSVLGVIKSLPGRIRDLGGRFFDVGKSLIQSFISGLKGAGGLVSDIAGNVWNAVKAFINSGIARINAALEFTISLPLGKHLTIDPKDIPPLARGGRATGATLAVIGEGREPESVLPDSVLRGLLGRAAAGAGAGSVGALTITNWAEGTGYFRLVASGEVADDRRFRRNLGSMHA